jgi:transposase InsO family protein
MGRAGSALDDAMAESFVSTLKAEMGTGSFDTREPAGTAIFDYIEKASTIQAAGTPRSDT